MAAKENYGDLLKVLVGHSAWVRSLAVSSDGLYLYSGACDATVKVWRVSTGDCVRTLTGHQGDINSVSLTAGDHFLITASKDTTAKIWRVKPGAASPPLERQSSVPKDAPPAGSEDVKHMQRTASVGKLTAALSATRPKTPVTPSGHSSLAATPHHPWTPSTADEVIDSWSAGAPSFGGAESGLDNDAVVCPICKEDFTFEGAAQPLLLPCGHTYCQSCLSKQKPLVCALCREPAGCGVGDLKKNYTLVDVIRTLTVGDGDGDGPDVVDGFLPPAAVRAATPSPEKGGAAGLGGVVDAQDRRRKSFESGAPWGEKLSKSHFHLFFWPRSLMKCVFAPQVRGVHGRPGGAGVSGLRHGLLRPVLRRRAPRHQVHVQTRGCGLDRRVAGAGAALPGPRRACDVVLRGARDVLVPRMRARALPVPADPDRTRRGDV